MDLPPAPTINALTLNGEEDNSRVRFIPLGENPTFSCHYDTSADAMWFRNGVELMDGTEGVVITTTAMSSTLQIADFQEAGVYQCRVTASADSQNVIETVVIGAIGMCVST